MSLFSEDGILSNLYLYNIKLNDKHIQNYLQYKHKS